MKKKNIHQYLSSLRKKIKKHQYLYHILGKSEIPDFEYDLMIRKLDRIEKEISEKSKKEEETILSDLRRRSKKIKHYSPMLSLNNVFNQHEYLKFYKNILKIINNQEERIYFCCELKIDGLAVNLVYKNGEFHSASTRGNGETGEDISSKIQYIRDIPLSIRNRKGCVPELIEIRGEIFMKFKKFQEFNSMLKKEKKKTFSNPRSAAIGLVKKVSQKEIIRESLNFFSYGCGLIKLNNTFESPKNQFECLKMLKTWNVPIVENTKMYSCSKKILEYYKNIYNMRDQLDYGIDGIVIKVNSFIYQKIIGHTSYAPKWSVAFKFPAKKKITTLLDVIFQVGRTGVITPIAKIDTISFNGIQINRVSLHNTNFIKDLGIMIGDKVIVSIAGDIIPKITGKIFDSTSNHINEIVFPKYCPSCFSITQIEKKGKIRCTGGLSCLSQRESLINHFVSKKAINIIGIGKMTVKKMVQKNLISDPSDLYSLKFNDLLSLNGITQATSKKILNSIEKSKNITLERFLYSLGIPGVGYVLSKKIASNSESYQFFLRISSGEKYLPCKIPFKGIGKNITENIISFFKKDHNRRMFSKLRKIFNIK
ncbi:NAD-dependent DNA ligase LigA [Candidatus Riesia pediculicola]|uniref:NAD-dependent DNA ligase LigA n=1 Tax=Candidatus Riesia pediculicola TaxID=401619 RepID=UPI0009B7805B|nr:NAD-dependent DNA ligase LigA [Candidatus Riesia pediculicola]ARC53994.1 hypothetical protein AOE55_02475 [Candidatus Riesia pediculicola]